MSLLSGSRGCLQCSCSTGNPQVHFCAQQSIKHISDQSRWVCVKFCISKGPESVFLFHTGSSECQSVLSSSLWVVDMGDSQLPIHVAKRPYSAFEVNPRDLGMLSVQHRVLQEPSFFTWKFSDYLQGPFYFDPRASKYLSMYTTDLDVFQKWFPSVLLCVWEPLMVFHSIQRSPHAFLFNRRADETSLRSGSTWA